MGLRVLGLGFTSPATSSEPSSLYVLTCAFRGEGSGLIEGCGLRVEGSGLMVSGVAYKG